ncbi:Ulk/ulk protein kinase, partial [Globisporangium splendens]
MSRATIGDYVVTSKLGSGSFAVVYKGYHKVTKVPVAIKAMSLSKLNSKLLANLETEISIMRQIDHPNIVKLYEIKKTEKHIYLILEYCAGGDLQQYMRRQEQKSAAVQAAAGSASGSAAPSMSTASSITGVVLPSAPKREKLSEETAQHFLKELAQGMKCLWNHNLIHRDLKPQNLLLMEDSPTSALKIATASLAETLCGSPLYMAPEILKFQKYDAKADLWSVGTILYEMVVGRPPYGGSNHVQLLANIERSDLRFPSNVDLSMPCKNLLLGLLQRKPMNRMGFDEFFNHPFVGLRGTGEHGDFSAPSLALSVTRSTTAMSIHEEDEEADNSSNGQSEKEPIFDASPVPGTSATPSALAHSSRRAMTKERAASDSHDAPSPSSSALRHSRSGNMEVMKTVFGSTSSAGSAALRRSSRLGRSRRSTSSGAILVGQLTNSPKLSPQMSPHILPSPSPRINPFKAMSESPPGMQLSSQMRASGGLPHGSQRLTRPSIPSQRQMKSGNIAMDSSGEYVLVESSGEKPALSAVGSESEDGTRVNVAQGQEMASFQPTTGTAIESALPNDSLMAQQLVGLTPFSHEYGQQLVDIVLLRAQAISPIAEQLWKLSSAAGSNDQRESSSSASGGNIASMFSMNSSISSSSGQAMVGGSASSMMFGDEDSANTMIEKKQYVCAAEALALYVKCLRIIQQGISYLRQDPTLSKRLTTSAPSSATKAPVSWSEASRKLSMAYLMEQLNCFLDRAEQCKKRMSGYLASATDSALVSEFQNVVVSQEELLYSHAIRLGKQGAVKEVLGQTRLAYEHYLQSMLLLESLLMETPAQVVVSGRNGAVAIEDQKRVNAFLKALDERLKNVKQLLDEDGVQLKKQQVQFDTTVPSSSPLTSSPP